jgi:hypothetical protein
MGQSKMPITKDNKVHKCCARTLSVNSTYLEKQIQATKSSNPIGLEKQYCRPTHNPLMLNIEKNKKSFSSISIMVL